MGSVAIKPSVKATATSTSKDSVQTESIPDPIEQQRANVVTKGKQLSVEQNMRKLNLMALKIMMNLMKSLILRRNPRKKMKRSLPRPHPNPLPPQKTKEKVSNP